MIYFIYLASGNSSRFGSENKLLQRFKGKELFKHGMDVLHTVSLNCDNTEIITVTKYQDIKDYSEKLCIKTVYEASMPNEISYTIKLGIKAINDLQKEDFLVFLVSDQPLISETTLESFIKQSENNILTACAFCSDKKGNPVMFSAKLVNELLALEGDVGGKSILKKHPPVKILVNNENELKDVDSIQCLEKLQAY